MNKIIGQFDGLFNCPQDLRTCKEQYEQFEYALTDGLQYSLAWHTVGRARIIKTKCFKCKVTCECLEMGEDEYGYGHICLTCIIELFDKYMQDHVSNDS